MEGRAGEVDGANPRDLRPAQALLGLAVDRVAGEEGFQPDRAQGGLAAEKVGRAVMRFEDTVSLGRIVPLDGSGKAHARPAYGQFSTPPNPKWSQYSAPNDTHLIEQLWRLLVYEAANQHEIADEFSARRPIVSVWRDRPCGGSVWSRSLW